MSVVQKPIGIFIVDDHQIVIDGLKSLLEGDAGFSIIGSTTHPDQAAALIAGKPVDILLTDVMMPGMNGQELARTIRKKFPAIKILALSMSGQGDVVDEMINEADINGYVLKNIGREELSTAIRKIAAGGIYYSEEVLLELERQSHKKKTTEECQLTIREVEIVKLIEEELNNKEIADRLFISERTVETHRKNIFRKTGTSSVIGLIKYAYEHGIIRTGRG
jgi:DNA-binding NarL/FixJ family response regulator